MAYANVFKRYEIKFILTAKQKKQLLAIMEDYMKLDQYGRTTISNIYYDTEDFSLIRRSLEKPVYKEKLRVRSYGVVSETDNVFVEIKKKYKGIVYKRRLALPEHQASDWIEGYEDQPFSSQIADEIDYFKDYHCGLQPACYLSYEREAYFDPAGSDFRVTFDENILGRTYDMTLTKGAYGEKIIPRGVTLMEIKTSGAIPLWVVDFLASNGIQKTSFSKYGTFYKNHIAANVTAVSAEGGLMYA